MAKDGKLMNNAERIVKHLEMTQSVIDRMGRNSFQLKGWSMTIIVAATVLIARTNLPSPFFVFVFLIPILGFWGLDGYFLWQERLFREVYNDVRKQIDTDFEMNLKKHKNKQNCKWRKAVRSIAIWPFYLLEILLTIAMFAIVWFC